MPRLPDIPIQSWIADQVDLFNRHTQGYLPAIEFEDGAKSAEEQIPQDYPYPGGEDQWQAAQEQAQSEEIRRRQQEAEQAYQAQQLAEQQRQKSLADNALTMAQSLGIPVPSEISDHFQSIEGTPPGTGDNTSTTGVFEPGTQPVGMTAPQDIGEYSPSGLSAGTIDRTPNIETNGESPGRFTPMQNQEQIDTSQYDLSQPPPMPDSGVIRPMTLAEERGRAIGKAASALWDIPSTLDEATRNIPGQVSSFVSSLPERASNAASALWDTAGNVAQGEKERFSAIGQLVGGDNALTELGAGLEGVGRLGKYVYGMGTHAPEAAQAGYEAIPGALEAAKETIPSIPQSPAGVLTEGPKALQLLAMGPLAPGLAAYSHIEQAAVGKAARAAAIDQGFTDAPITKNPVTGEPISALDIAEHVVPGVVDPLNVIGGEEVAQAAHGAGEAGRFVPRAREIGPGAGRRFASALWNVPGQAASAVAETPLGQGVARGLESARSTIGQGLREAGATAAETPLVQGVARGLDQADVLAGQGASLAGAAARAGGRYAYQFAQEHPEVPATFAGAAADRYLNPDATPEESLGSGLALAGAIRARRLPMTQSIEAGFRRMFHGSPTDFAKPLAKFFNPDGLFGPAYYLTSDPRVAATYAQSWEDRFPIGPGAEEFQRLLDQSGPNIRPVDINDQATLFQADKVVPPSDWRRIIGALNRIYGDDPEAAQLIQHYDVALQSGEKSTGEALYNSLAADFTPYADMKFDLNTEEWEGSKGVANHILSEAGFDGVHYKGGRLGAVDADTGKVIEHDAVAMFPDKLDDALRGAYTRESAGSRATPQTSQTYQAAQDAMDRPGAIPAPLGREMAGSAAGPIEEATRNSITPFVASRASTVGSSIAGGIIGGATAPDDATWEDRTQRALVGVGIGAAAGGKFGVEATIGAAKLLDSLVRRGILDADTFWTHPMEVKRMQAMLNLAAEGVPDNQIVEIPGLVRYLFRSGIWEGRRAEETRPLVDYLSRLDANLPEFMGSRPSTLTAGQIRAATQEVSTPRRVLQDIGEIVTDALTNLERRGQRQRENAADVVSVRGQLPEGIQRDIVDIRETYAGDLLNTAGGQVRAADSFPIPEGHPFKDKINRMQDAVERVADRLGLPPPRLFISQDPRINAYANELHGYRPTVTVTRGLMNAPLTDAEIESVLAHEMGHTGQQLERAFKEGGEEIGLYRIPSMENMASRYNPPELPESVRALGVDHMPVRGVWQERLSEDMRLPEGLSLSTATRAQNAYEQAVKLVGRSQGPMRATTRTRLLADAEKAWQRFEELRGPLPESPKTAVPGVVGAETLRTLPRSQTTPEIPSERVVGGEPSPTPPTERAAQAETAGLGANERPVVTEVPYEVGIPRNAGREGLPETAPVSAPEAGDISFSEPLPTEIDPRQIYSHEDAGKLISQLHDSLAAQPQDQAWADRQAALLMGQPKIFGRFLTTLLEGVGRRRALARYGNEDEQAAQFAQKFLRDHGWVAPAEGEVGRATEALARGPAEEAARVPETLPSRPVSSETDQHVSNAMEADTPEQALTALGETLASRPKNGIAEDYKKIPILRDGVKVFEQPTPQDDLSNPRLTEMIHNAWRHHFISAFTDKESALVGVQNDIARIIKDQTGKLIPPELTAAMQKRFNSNRSVDMDIQDYFRPHQQTFHRLGIPTDLADMYLLNQQGMDIARNMVAEKRIRNVGDRTFPGGKTYDQMAGENIALENYLKERLTPEQYQEFQGAIDGVHQFGDRILQYLRAGDVISEDTYQTLRQKYPHYVPTRIVDYLRDEGYMGRGKSLSVNSTTLHELTTEGTSKTPQGPMSAMLQQAYQAHEAANKNHVFNSFVNLWKAASGLSDIPGVEMPTPQTATSNLERRVANFAKGVIPMTAGEGGISSAIVPTGIKGKPIPQGYTPVRGYRDGIPLQLAVDNRLGDITKWSSPPVIPLFSGLSQLFRAGATSRNPLFLTSNAVLDLMSILQREGAREGATPAAYGRVLREWFNAMGKYVVHPQAIHDMFTGTYRGDMAEALREGGGMSGGHYSVGGLRPQDWGSTETPAWLGGRQIEWPKMRRAVFGPPKSPAEQALEKLRHPGLIHIDTPADAARLLGSMLLLKPVENLGERIELAGRTVGYRLSRQRSEREIAALEKEQSAAVAAIKQGLNPTRDPRDIQDEIDQAKGYATQNAVNRFRTSTLDFDKGGWFMKAFNQFVPFSNVGVQSLADIGRGVQENNVAYPAAALATLVTPMILAEAWNQGDPQRAKDYADIPSYIKDQGLVVMMPEGWGGGKNAPVDQQGNRHPQFAVMRARQMAPLAIATRELLQRTLYNNPNMTDADRRSLMEMILSGWEQISPVSAGSAQDAMVGITPPGVQTGLQLAFDTDTFRQRRIQSQYASDRASPLSHAISSAVSNATGSDYLTPARAEFITRDIGSGYAGLWHGASELVGGNPNVTTGGPALTSETPGLGGLYSRFVKGSIGGQAEMAQQHPITDSAHQILRQNGITDWTPQDSPPAIKNVPLTRLEYAEYQRQINQSVDEIIHELGNYPDWVALPPADKKATLQSELSRARERIGQQFLERIPEDEIGRRLQREIDAGRLPAVRRR